MKFRYKRYGEGILRPVIPIEVSYQGRSVPYEVLVDSGADLCIFDAQIAEILDINVTDGEKGEVFGITGDPQPLYLHTLTIIVGGWPLQVRIGFLPGISQSGGYGVVGQHGFFEKYIVKFDFVKEEVELIPRT